MYIPLYILQFKNVHKFGHITSARGAEYLSLFWGKKITLHDPNLSTLFYC